MPAGSTSPISQQQAPELSSGGADLVSVIAAKSRAIRLSTLYALVKSSRMGDEDTDSSELEQPPTELAGAASSDTESVHAWAFDDELDDNLPGHRFTPKRITIAAVAVSLTVAAGAAMAVVLHARGEQAPEHIAAAADEPSPWLVPPPTPSAGPLPTPEQRPEGTYRVVYDWPRTAWHLSPRSVQPQPDAVKSEWWSFTTKCASRCVATGVPLTGDAGTPVPNAGSILLEFDNGIWRHSPPRSSQYECAYIGADGQQYSATNTNTLQWTWAPQPDGSFGGNMTTRVETNECGFQGDWSSTPLSVTRVGDPPPGP